MGEVNPQTVLEVFGLCETDSKLHFAWTLTNTENGSVVRTVSKFSYDSKQPTSPELRVAIDLKRVFDENRNSLFIV